MDKFAAIRAFVVVAQKHGFSAAARQLGVTASVVTKRVTSLEQELQVTLFARNTRKLALTLEGEAFFERCRDILSSLESAELDLAQSNTQPMGRLHVQLPMVVARLHVIPRLKSFFLDYPQVDLRITQSDSPQDLIGDGIDVAVWSGELPESRLVARRLTRSLRVTCAAPSYLAARGRPESPDDLPRHNCVRAARYHGGRSWLFLMP
ncbi:MAG: h16, partial [Rhizobacter sp.]|nr:h16 [Rhizobacter sp.]